jgi:hypothetical protein
MADKLRMGVRRHIRTRLMHFIVVSPPECGFSVSLQVSHTVLSSVSNEDSLLGRVGEAHAGGGAAAT